ncbi:DEAD/DEAH box helicase [Candidatus Saccharibacteria bacterium]|nr:DEAD/DEAH box helicase [Candidatus Saccharibacteria bacterium]
MSYQTYRPRNAKPRYGTSRSSRPTGNRRSTKQYIHPSKFVKPAQLKADIEVYTPINVFADFSMHPILHGNLVQKGFVSPTPIQDQAIPHGLEGRDVVGIANTGTGKTIAFAIPVLHQLMNNRSSNALIMAPTRELAQQIEAECRMIAKGSGLSGTLLIGGTSMGPQLNGLRNKPRIVIGTPGRIKDHITRGTLEISKFDIVVLDEVDRMLDMGFVTDITFILNAAAPKRQSFFFSATMDPKVNVIMRNFTSDPITISVKTGDTSDAVEQDIVAYNTSSDKIEQLHELLNKAEVAKVLVFDETQRSVERLSRELQARGFKADDIHGGKSQGQRQRALRSFRDNNIRILVATDVAARGIDIIDITHVINYSQPQTYDDYIHRIGRAGRAGRTGFAYTFVQS